MYASCVSGGAGSRGAAARPHGKKYRRFANPSSCGGGGRLRTDAAEDVLRCLDDHARVLRVPDDGVGFARTRLPVGQERAVEAGGFNG